MPIRITGMNSGLDTESIISELVKAKSTKKNQLVKKQKTLEYKQDAWKTINSKIYGFYSSTLSDMRWKTSYAKKKTEVSDSSAASVITGEGAMNGTQSLEVKELAKAAYLTGGEIKNLQSGQEVTGDTKLSDLMSGLTASSNVSFKFAGQEVSLTGDDTVTSFVNKLKSANSKVNVSFDDNNDRIFIGAKATGKDGNFDFTDLSSDAAELLGKLGIFSTDTNGNVVTGTDGNPVKSNYVKGQDAEILLNGAKFESSGNTFKINGLTIEAKNQTNGAVTLTTSDDYDGIYDMVKNFFKEYNTMMKEIGTLYNADSLNGMEPLTDEEKDALSDKEVEKWEEKLKTAALRRDSTLGELNSMISTTMLQGIEVGGKTLYLSSFGISTSGYFESDAADRNAFHIDGNKDDSKTSGNTDKLKTMIANDPEMVANFFSELSRTLYDKMTESMSSIKDTRSIYKVYNDKQMQKEYDDYTSKIADQDALITAYEDRYYKQFSKMETALAKLQSKESALSGLLGG